MEGKRCVSDIVNPSVLALRDHDMPSTPIVVRFAFRNHAPQHPSTNST
jgi:hypothetical protein